MERASMDGLALAALLTSSGATGATVGGSGEGAEVTP
jgi:hypothetical protein